MQQVYVCLTQDHDWYLVALATAVCLLASATTVSLFHRARATVGHARLMWMSLDAMAAGCGIWATHFIAMLAYTPTADDRYTITLTVLSFVISTLIAGAGFGMAAVGFGHVATVCGGLVAGLGIAAMHYTGMMALELPGSIIWTPSLVVASIVFGTLFGLATTYFATLNANWTNTAIATLCLTLAIVTMHFTAMGAIAGIPAAAGLDVASALSRASLSFVIAGITALILGMSLVAAISDRKSESKLRAQKDLLDTALENMCQGLCMFDADGKVVLFNHRFVDILGFPTADIRGKTLLDLVANRAERGMFFGDPREYAATVLADISKGETCTRTITSTSGRVLRVVQQPRAGGGWVSTVEDITEMRAAQQRLTYLAHHDVLTGLANRAQLIERLEASLKHIEPTGSSIAIHLVDLDRFKSVNDTLGHDAGDFLLKTIAARLRAVTRESDLVARLGGDEFVVLQTGITDRNQADTFAQRIISEATVPINFNEHMIVATLSIGIAMAPGDATTPEQLMKCADLALYAAKADGRNCVRFFRPEMDAELQARTSLEKTLRNAVANNRFELHYQPLFEMNDRKLIGFEALIRLQKDDGTLIPPLDFIPLAEELHLIEKIGAWVLHEACRTAATWPAGLTVAVNLSPSQFEAGSVSEIVADALKSTNLAPHRLELEITETLLLADSEAIMKELQTIKAMGASVVMDDFGTGYSSLSYLWKFPFNKIKIDRSFMQGLNETGRDAETVVKTIIALGRELNMRVTVEGVETADQASFLDQADGDQAQGFFFGRPVPATEVSANILSEFRKSRMQELSEKRVNNISSLPSAATS